MSKLVLVGAEHGRPFRQARVNGEHPFVKALEKAFNSSEVNVNPSNSVLKSLTLQYGGTATSTGGIRVSSRVKSRSAKETGEVSPEKLSGELISMVMDKIRESEWLAVPRTMCEADGFKSSCMVVAPVQYARIPYMWGKTLFGACGGRGSRLCCDVLPRVPGKQADSRHA